MKDLIQIAIIDDDITDRQLIRITLEKAMDNIEITEIASKNEFVKVIKKQSFHIIITDYNLKESTGLEVTADLRGRGITTPIIMLTGEGNEAIAIEAIKQGVDQYVLKTLQDIKSLPEVINKLIQGQNIKNTLKVSVNNADNHLINLMRVFDHSPIGLVVVDREDVISQSNNTFCDLIGYSKEELSSIRMIDLVLPDDHEICILKQNKLFTGEIDNYTIEKRLIHKNGHSVWGDVSVSVVRNESGDPQYSVLQIKDISKRKKNEWEIQNIAKGISAETGEAFFHSLTKHLAETLNVDYAIISRFTDEEQASAISVYSHGKYINDLEYSLYGSPCANVKKKIITKYINDVQKHYPEFSLLADLEIEGYLGVPLIDSSDHAIGLIVILNTMPLNNIDIASSMLKIFGIRATAELERIRVVDELINNEEKTRLILENSLDGFITIDTQGLVNQWNKQSENIFGWTLEEVLGKKLSDLIIPKDQQKAHIKGMQHLVEIGEGPILNKHIEVKALHKDGHIIPIELAISPIDSGGEVLYSAFVRDITDRLNHEAQLVHAQKMEMMGQLTGGIAHDFNNLLTVIIGNLKFLKEEIEDDLSEEDKLLIDSALTAAWDGAELTHGLLAVSRKQLLQPTSIEVNSAIDELIYMIKRTLGTNINITFSEYISPVNVFADPTQLKNALFNLAINARDAMPNGGDIRIDAKLKDFDSNSDNLEPGSYVVISVTDNGIGMTEEQIEKVFDPFFTTKEIGRGTGLGLSTVYGFTKQSGGITSISSTLGKGTTVSIILPATDVVNEISLDDSIEEEIAHGTETILVTEDEAGVRMLAVKILKKYGYNVLEAENAYAAIEIMNSGKNIDLLFSDIMMPGKMSGTDLSSWAAENYPDIKIILTTGFDKKSFKKDSSISPSIPVLHKPYSKAQLAMQVRLSLDS